ncbi:MAG: prepilin-type N-terminal cleavage/methylation domain-containing protein [Patescibacteria group bacterium]
MPNLRQDQSLLHSQSGFSLVEMLIVVTLTVMIIVTASSVLLTTLLSGGQVNTTKTIKQNGDYAMGQMTTLLRNAVKLLPNDVGQTCVNGMTQLRFRSLDEGITTFERTIVSPTDARIASNSAIYLTSDAVYVTNGLQFDCQQTADGVVTNVTISFTLSKGNQSSSRVTDVGTQDFTSTVIVRGF